MVLGRHRRTVQVIEDALASATQHQGVPRLEADGYAAAMLLCPG